ncbi:putative cell wall glycosyl hydrolase YteR [Elsinoe ampelina]|uniref:Putative cell wall glycosyl hydrolase YteR n=1 Tax=Elsinoe ampelina TaxID=302913 RepID=A0A6A6G097_9PEZI|nr:putative cell wall glycosyl hydrolase YteR [Elsinoe ampelina]
MRVIPLVTLATTALSAAIERQASPLPQYSTIFTDAFLQRGIPANNRYENAVFHRAVELVAAATGNTTYTTWLKTQLDRSVTPNGTLLGYPAYPFSLDDVRIGTILLDLAARHPTDTRYRVAADTLRAQLNLPGFRTPLGGFFHRSPTYPNQMWLDGIFMADVFYAQYTAAYQPANVTAWDDILLQYELIDGRTRNTTTNLLVHGYDEGKKAVWADAVTGAAPNVWDRALGWYLMALVDVLDFFPRSHKGYEVLVGFFRSAAEGVLRAQDEGTGGWWLVMNEPYPGRAGNYIESSGSAMFVYALLKGVRLGYIGDEYVAPMKRGYEYLGNTFVKRNETDGLVDWTGTVVVGSLNSNASFEYYTGVATQINDLKGVGPFIYASLEYEALA